MAKREMNNKVEEIRMGLNVFRCGFGLVDEV